MPEGVVCLNVTHSNLKAYIADIKIDLHTSIENVKHKLYSHTGTKPHYQRLSLYDGEKYLYPLDDNSKKLGYYSVENGMRIHIFDQVRFFILFFKQRIISYSLLSLSLIYYFSLHLYHCVMSDNSSSLLLRSFTYSFN